VAVAHGMAAPFFWVALFIFGCFGWDDYIALVLASPDTSTPIFYLYKTTNNLKYKV